MRILLIEDQERLAINLKQGLELEGFAVDVQSDGLTAYRHASLNHEDYDLILLDIMLPGKDGISICRDLRANQIKTPILFLTAKNQAGDVVTGLNEGADDYLRKPFVFEELLARIRTLLRRPATFVPDYVSCDGLELDLSAHTAALDGKVVDLTLKEFALLEYLMRHPNQVLNREQLLASGWDSEFSSFSNVVDVHVKNLRKKLGGWGVAHLETVYGVGYRFKR